MRQVLTIPSQFVIDYQSFCATARDDLAGFLRKELPFMWRDVYIENTRHRANVHRFEYCTLEYFYDFYSELEAQGLVPHSETI